VGDSGAGKTSVLRWLRQRPLRTEHDSTDGADIITVDLKDWNRSRLSLNQIMATVSTTTATITKDTDIDHNKHKLQTMNNPKSTHYHEEKVKTASSAAAKEDQHLLHHPRKLKLDAEDWASDERMTYHVWDFGGQQVYYHTHHIFFSNNAVYLLVVDVSRDDYLERMTFWLHSIRGYSYQTQINNIAIVGTHRDKLTTEEQTNREKKIVGQLHKLSSRGGDIKLPTNNDVMLVSCKDDPVSSNLELKQRLLQLSEQLNKDQLYDARSVVLLDLLMQNLPKSTSGKLTWVSISDVIAQGSKCNMDESEVASALQWYHELGFVLHWSDNKQLKDKVYLKPEELVNAFRTIISFRYQHLIRTQLEEYVIEDAKQQHKKELEEGRIGNIILDKIWKEYKEEKESLRELFVKFGLAVKMGNYLVFPCLVTRSQPPAEPMKRYLNNSRFEMDVVVGPLGFTSRLVQYMLTRMTEQWKERVKSEIYQDGAVFVVEGLKLRLIILKALSIHGSIAEVKAIELRTEPTNQQMFNNSEIPMKTVWEALKMIEEFVKTSKCAIAHLTSSCLSCYREEHMELPMTETYQPNCVCDPPTGTVH